MAKKKRFKHMKKLKKWKNLKYIALGIFIIGALVIIWRFAV